MEEKWANFRKTFSFFGEFRAGLDEPARILLNSTLALSTLCFVVLVMLGGLGTALFPLLILGGVGFYVYKKLQGLEAQHSSQPQGETLSEDAAPKPVEVPETPSSSNS